jgi:hypothetical protein
LKRFFPAASLKISTGRIIFINRYLGMNLIYYFALHQQLRENSAETEVTVRNHSFAVIRIQTALCTVNISKTDKNMLSETIINMQKFT